jgi:hypothetical protein
MTMDPSAVAAVLELARMAVPTASERHVTGMGHPPLAEAVARLTHPWRDENGAHTIHAQCSRSGHPAPLARVVDPIDRLDPACDPIHLVTARRRVEHAARVLALAAAPRPRPARPSTAEPDTSSATSETSDPATRTATPTEPADGGEDDVVAPTAATSAERLAVVRDDLASGITAVRADAAAGHRRLTRQERTLLAAADALLGAVDWELQHDESR